MSIRAQLAPPATPFVSASSASAVFPPNIPLHQDPAAASPAHSSLRSLTALGACPERSRRVAALDSATVVPPPSFSPSLFFTPICEGCTLVHKSEAHPLTFQSLAHSVQKHRGCHQEHSPNSSSFTLTFALWLARPSHPLPFQSSPYSFLSGLASCAKQRPKRRPAGMSRRLHLSTFDFQRSTLKWRDRLLLPHAEAADKGV